MSGVAEAPPQPPLRAGDDDPPPIVEGIGGAAGAAGAGAEALPAEEAGQAERTERAAQDARLTDVPPPELASFLELVARFEGRVDRAATGRKYRELRAAWDDAVAEISRFPDRVDLANVSDRMGVALRLGCESAKVAVVDACLDCAHRLFEYGHLGGAREATYILLDEREGALEEVVAVVCGCLEVKEEEVYLRMVQTLLTAATSTKSGLHHGTLLAAVRTIYNIFLNAKMPGTRTTARVSLTQILTLVFGRMEAEAVETPYRLAEEAAAADAALLRGVSGDSEDGANGRAKEGGGEEEGGEEGAKIKDDGAKDTEGGAKGKEKAGKEDAQEAQSEFSSILQKDAYLLFRALCKLSAKDLSEDSLSESVGLRSKLLSLELLRGLVSASGPMFRSGERFIYALRHYLAPSLLTNCMSTAMEVVDLSLDIFDMLVRKETLRPLLKTEIGAFFDTVLFRFLESPSAGPARRRRALAVLNRLSSDRQTLADIFLNYDCDMESPKVFERIVSVLSIAAESPAAGASPAGLQAMVGSDSGMSPVQEEELRMSALSSVVHVVGSLREWSKPIEDTKGENMGTAVHVASAPDQPYGSPAPGVNGKHAGDALTNGVDHQDSVPPLQPSSSMESRTSEAGEGGAHGLSLSGSNGSILGGSSGGAMLGMISEGTDHDTSRFEQALRTKRTLEQGVIQFNTKPKRGVEFLCSSNVLVKEPIAVADFLMKTEKLDATMVGEYLGEGDTFNVSVMHAYTDKKDMANTAFDSALRTYLSGFRLPGESQKIDRIMEKFASRYCECNPAVFANAETAFILAYSTIMLHTDAHNPMVKKKMTKEEFFRNNRGINDGKDLPQDFLGGLYDRITTSEFRLAASMRDSAHEAATAAMAGGAVAVDMVDPAERARRFKEESDRLMGESRVLFATRRKTTEDYTYYSASNVYHARLMFEAAWCPVLAALSVLLEKATPSDTNTVALCLEGLRNSIAIASTFGMSTTKDAFVSSLAKFTHLNSVSDMRAKNVECVRMILAIAAMEGNNLGEQWVVIVRAISQVEQIRAVAAGNPRKFILPKMPIGSSSPISGPRSSDSSFDKERSSLESGPQSSPPKGAVGNGTASLLSGSSSGTMFGTRRSSSAATTSQSFGHVPGSGANGSPSTSRSAAESPLIRIDSKAATVATLIDEAEIERVFVNSSRLSASGVADFCSALCIVALEELGERRGPRLFCLQKIIEMAYYNMESRTRIQWSKIWEQMGPFFVSAMCHDNRDVSMYSIDALRQLASKFLEKDELSNFSFQRAFLKPFEQCFSRSKAVPVRELVLTCVSQIVLARAANIKSGWKSVFAVLALAADDRNESIVNFGYQIVESIVRKYFGELDDVFVDAVTGISSFARSPLSSSISLAAVDLLTDKCSRALADGNATVAARPVLKDGTPVVIANSNLASDSETLRDNHATKEQRVSESLFTADVDAHIGTWFPILTGLAAAVQDERPTVRAAASKGLYKVLSENGGRFAPSLWVLVFRGVLLPMFDDVRHLSASHDRLESSAVAEWASSAGSVSLRSLVDVLVQHLEVTRVLLPDVLRLIESWVVQENEAVAREGMSVLTRLIKTAGDMMVPDDWLLIVNSVEKLIVETMPHEILGPGGKEKGPAEASNLVDEISPVSNSGDQDLNGEPKIVSGDDALNDCEEKSTKKIDFRVVRAKCVVQLLLIQLVQDVVVSFYLDLETAHILMLAGAVEKSYTFAHEFNANIELRFSLWRSGFMNQVPNLLKQETTGLTAYLRVVFWLYLDHSKGTEVTAEHKLFALCNRVLHRFVRACEEMRSKPEEQREVSALIPVVIFIVNGMLQMSTEQFTTHLPKMYHILLSLLESSDDRLVRGAVVNLFRARIGSAFEIPEEDGSPAILFTPNPQIPGRVRERLLAVSGVAGDRALSTEVQTTLSKVSGVRTAFVNVDDGVARVFASTPDELLVAAVSGVAGVTEATLMSVEPDAAEGRADQ